LITPRDPRQRAIFAVGTAASFDANGDVEFAAKLTVTSTQPFVAVWRLVGAAA
jgi:hypothetical protein